MPHFLIRTSDPLNLSSKMDDHKTTEQSAMGHPVALEQNRESDSRRLHFNEPVNFTLWKKGSRLFSLLFAINILLFGCTLITSSPVSQVPIRESAVLIFLSILMLLSILWMFFKIYFTNRYQDAILFKDCHAGPIWMRGALLVFAFCTLLLDAFKVGYFLGYVRCLSLLHFIYPVIQTVFVVVQTYFLWVSCKHCVQIHLNSTRLCLMLLFATNFAVWMTTVTDESSHLTRQMLQQLNITDKEPGNVHRHMSPNLDSTLYDKSANTTDCNCNNVCEILTTAYYHLYPFFLEYSLFACAMIYVMWKNVGRVIDDNFEHPHHLKLRYFWHLPFVALGSGIIVFAVGLALFVLYELSIKKIENRVRILIVFFIFHIVCLGLMSVGAIAGWTLYKYDIRQMDNSKNPSRTLDMILLVGSTLGQYCISYYSIAAMVASNPRDLLRILTLTMSVLMIVQHSLQNIFIIEGLHRKIPKEWLRKHDESHPTPSTHGTNQEDENGITAESINKVHRRLLSIASIREIIASSLSTHRRRRMMLREIYVFLVIGNILVSM